MINKANIYNHKKNQAKRIANRILEFCKDLIIFPASFSVLKKKLVESVIMELTLQLYNNGTRRKNTVRNSFADSLAWDWEDLLWKGFTFMSSLVICESYYKDIGL